MSHRYRRGRGRAQSASAEALFERALLGDERSSRQPFDPKNDRKTLQLCRQVHRALTLALGGECADDVLRDVEIESVRPMGSAAHLLVRVAVSTRTGLAAGEVLARLNDRAPRLRSIVAQSISRKRAPGLSFVAVPSGVEGGRS